MTEASGAVVVEKELDALVAEKVMGWERGTKNHQLASMWPYSRDIAAAWRVVERMRELGWSYEICGGPTRHSVSFCEIATDTLEFAHHADAPRAICLAALKALGVTV